MQLPVFQTKVCSKCKQSKDRFSPDKRASDGLQSQCRECCNLQQSLKPYKPKTREAAYRHNKKWVLNNPGKKAAHLAKRYATKTLRTPDWLTKDQLKEIESYYVLAKELSWLSESPLEVDHIVPLHGDNVSGLHVPWNLQLLPMLMNIAKGNKVL